MGDGESVGAMIFENAGCEAGPHWNSNTDSLDQLCDEDVSDRTASANKVIGADRVDKVDWSVKADKADRASRAKEADGTVRADRADMSDEKNGADGPNRTEKKHLEEATVVVAAVDMAEKNDKEGKNDATDAAGVVIVVEEADVVDRMMIADCVVGMDGQNGADG